MPLRALKEQVLLMKEAEKQRFDKMVHDLTAIPVSTTVSYMNKDQKNLVHRQGGKLHTKIICGTHRGGQINFKKLCPYMPHQCTHPSKTI